MLACVHDRHLNVIIGLDISSADKEYIALPYMVHQNLHVMYLAERTGEAQIHQFDRSLLPDTPETHQPF